MISHDDRIRAEFAHELLHEIREQLPIVGMPEVDHRRVLSNVCTKLVRTLLPRDTTIPVDEEEAI